MILPPSESDAEAARFEVESKDMATLVARVLLGGETDERDADGSEVDLEGVGLADGEREGSCRTGVLMVAHVGARG